MELETYAQFLIDEANRLILYSKIIMIIVIPFIAWMLFVIFDALGIVDWVRNLVKG